MPFGSTASVGMAKVSYVFIILRRADWPAYSATPEVTETKTAPHKTMIQMSMVALASLVPTFPLKSLAPEVTKKPWIVMSHVSRWLVRLFSSWTKLVINFAHFNFIAPLSHGVPLCIGRTWHGCYPCCHEVILLLLCFSKLCERVLWALWCWRVHQYTIHYVKRNLELGPSRSTTMHWSATK